MTNQNFIRIPLKNEKEWLNSRELKITGTLISAIVGENPYMTNTQAYQLFKGTFIMDDISNKPQVLYGKQAESHLRALFRLDNPQYKVIDPAEHELIVHKDYPYMAGSPDGFLVNKDGDLGILEIKTSEILSSQHREKWNNGNVPMNYYCQVLWYMFITGAKFAVLHAQLKYTEGKDQYTTRRNYEFYSEQVKDDIEWLRTKAIEFWKNVQENKEPNLIVNF